MIATLAAAVALALPPADDALPHAELAQAFLGDATDAAEPLEAALERRFARLRVGAFEVLHPTDALAEDERREDLARIARALLAGQRAWLAWVDPGGAPATKELAADLETFEEWIERWDARLFRERATDERDLLVALHAPEEVAQAAERAARAMAEGGPLAAARAEAAGDAGPPPLEARLVLLPTRAEFLGFVSALGQVHPRSRDVYWQPGIRGWIEARYEDTRAIALRFPPPPDEPWDAPGTAMDERNPKGLEEQVLQLALASLAIEWFEGRMDPDFASSLSNDLVIEVFGEVDTRSDGDLSPRSAPPRSVFVPGGLSSGGALPTNSAESPWRQGYGADHFVRPLQQAQKAGAREADERRAKHYFLLESTSGTERTAAAGPFLGAGTQAPPEQFGADFREFGRAYRAAFVWWLREKAAKKDSPARFAELLRRLHLAEPGADFAAILAEVYGRPLTASPPGEDDLEGRFLDWLSTAKPR